MSNFKCYQAADTTHVVLDPPSDHDTPPEAVVTISRAVGNPKARALMRFCAAVLNDDMPGAEQELDLIESWLDGEDDGERVREADIGANLPAGFVDGLGVSDD